MLFLPSQEFLILFKVIITDSNGCSIEINLSTLDDSSFPFSIVLKLFFHPFKMFLSIRSFLLFVIILLILVSTSIICRSYCLLLLGRIIILFLGVLFRVIFLRFLLLGFLLLRFFFLGLFLFIFFLLLFLFLLFLFTFLSILFFLVFLLFLLRVFLFWCLLRLLLLIVFQFSFRFGDGPSLSQRSGCFGLWWIALRINLCISLLK